MFFELADGHKAIDRITGEPADGFGHNQCPSIINL